MFYVQEKSITTIKELRHPSQEATDLNLKISAENRATEVAHLLSLKLCSSDKFITHTC